MCIALFDLRHRISCTLRGLQATKQSSVVQVVYRFRIEFAVRRPESATASSSSENVLLNFPILSEVDIEKTTMSKK